MNSILYFPNIGSKGCVYAAIPKAANSSIKSILSAYETNRMRITKVSIKELPLNPPVFSVIRNPYHRIVSLWRDKIALGDGAGSARIFTRHPNLELGMGFKDFVKAVNDISDNDCDPHIRSQAAILADIPIDFIGHFENLNTDWEKIKMLIGDLVSIPLPHLNNHGVDGKTDYMDYYNRFTKALVYGRYKSDFINYNYAKEF